jgi:D-glycero-D-manno-heptose 1,7-bisphosphate phosphatase
VTNQPEIATGELLPDVLEAIHARLRRETEVDAIYVCPHRDEHGCECRKPKPGMLLRAAKDHGIDLSASFLVGDRWRDIDAGEAAGCVTVLVAGSDESGGQPRYRVNDLRDAVNLIIGGVQQGR